MKKHLICILCVMLMILSCSCDFWGPQKYICNSDEVKLAQIVRLVEYKEDTLSYKYTVLAEISDVATFAEQVNNLEHQVNWGEPTSVQDGFVVIRIEYHNGDYDMIHPYAQFIKRSGVFKSSYFFFDNEEFDSLVSKYWSVSTEEGPETSQGTVCVNPNEKHR